MDHVSRALKTGGNTPKYAEQLPRTKAAAPSSRYLANKCGTASETGCFSEVIPAPSVFGEELRKQAGEWLSFSETGEIPQKNLDVVEETVVQAEEAADEIPRKLEKQEKKRLKTEKTGCHCPGITRKKQCEECEETSERPKEKQKPQKAPQEDGMENPSVSFSKPKKRKPFSKKELVSSDLEETAVEVFPSGRNLSPKKNQLVTWVRKQEGPWEKRGKIIFQGEATPQWTWRRCCQQAQ